MGYRFANLHVRASAAPTIESARAVGAIPAFVTSCAGGWTSVYPRPLEEPSAKLVETTRRLSEIIEQTFVLALEVYDSDVFRYVLAKDGAIVDQFVSNPAGYNGGRSRPKGGTVDAILPLCVPGTRAESLEILFRDARTKPRSTREDVEERRRRAKEIADTRERLRREDPDGWFQRTAELEATFRARYPRVGFDDANDQAEELAAHFGGLLGLDRARVVTGFKAISLQDEVLRGEILAIE